MEKSTQKFLSVLLSLAILFSFPVSAQAAGDSYESTFTGTYTAPSSARNVLVSGNDAAVSEWYGDRVNMGGATYSVRQDEYGLNKDGNMIKMNLNQTYTIWLAQYGVASFVFTAPKTGDYVLHSNENTKYGHAPDWQENKVLRPYLADDGTTKYYVDYIGESDVFSVQANETLYIVADADNKNDYVYDISVKNFSPEICPHNYNEVDTTYNGCEVTNVYECEYCFDTYTRIYTSHQSEYEEVLHEATNCCDYTVVESGCNICGYIKEYRYEYGDDEGYYNGPHIPASRVYDHSYDDSICYKCICALCGRTYYDWETSPCYNVETEETYHSFGSRYDVPCGQEATCAYCGYQTEGSHDWERTNRQIYETGSCETYVDCETCTKCGATDTDTWTSHSGSWEYVQITPQHDNVCGTFKYVCADCGEIMRDTPQICHSNSTSSNGCYETETCRRCGNVENHAYHDFNYGYGVTVAPTCTAQGGTLYTCYDCGATEMRNAVPATGHNFGNNSPSCLACGTANPNYIAPLPPTQPSQPAPTVPAATKSSRPKGAKKVDGVWVNTKQKKASLKKVSKAKKAFKVYWKKVSGVTGYQIQYSTSKKFTKKTTKSSTISKNKTTSKTIKKLKGKKKYYVRIRTYKNTKFNGKVVKVYSKWSSVKTVTTKK